MYHVTDLQYYNCAVYSYAPHPALFPATTLEALKLRLCCPNRQSPAWLFSYSATQSSSSEAEAVVGVVVYVPIL